MKEAKDHKMRVEDLGKRQSHVGARPRTCMKPGRAAPDMQIYGWDFGDDSRIYYSQEPWKEGRCSVTITIQEG